MRYFITFLVFILTLSVGAQTKEDGDRILKVAGINKTPQQYWDLRNSMGGLKFSDSLERIGREYIADDMAVSIGRCRTIFNTPGGIYITTIEWIKQSERYRPIVYQYTGFDANFDNGTLQKIESLQGYFILGYSAKSNFLLLNKWLLSIAADDDLANPIFNQTIYTYDLAASTMKLQFSFSYGKRERFSLAPTEDSIRYFAQQKNPGGVGSSYVPRRVKIN